MQREDLKGRRFGRLVVIERAESRKGRRFWRCRCDCGNELEVSNAHLTQGKTRSCGCAKKGVNMLDISGQKFGRLLAVKATDRRLGNSVVWSCKCDCGRMCEVAAINLKKGYTKSCGCIRKEMAPDIFLTARNARKNFFVEGTDILHISSNTIQKNNTSGITGVSYDSSVGLWKAYIQIKGKRYYLGGYRDINDAAEARKEAKKAVHGNFIEWYKETYPDEWKKLNGNKSK